MKPIKLIISGFGPFAKEQHIDFDRCGLDGLFLICGDTGSGKTTIFDSIMYSLYGEASGVFRDSASLRSGFAHDDEKTYVKLTFIHHGGEYTIERNPEYKRPKKRGSKAGDDLVTENKGASITLPNGDIISGYKQTTDFIIELLGIDSKQFKQVSMIAQGEFMNMLNAKSDLRSDILRKIFDTYRFNDLEKQLSELKNTLYNQCNEDARHIEDSIYKISVDQESTYYAKYSKLVEEGNIECIIEFLKHYISDQMETKNSFDTLLNTANAKARDMSTRMAIDSSNNDRLEKLETYKQSMAKLINQKSDIDDMKTVVDSYDKAISRVKPVADMYTSVKDRVEELKNQYDDGTLQLADNENKLIELKARSKDIEDKKTKLKELDSRLIGLNKEKELLVCLNDLKKQYLQIEKEKEASIEHLSGLRLQIEESKQYIDQLRTCVDNLKNLDIEYNKYIDEKHSLSLVMSEVGYIGNNIDDYFSKRKQSIDLQREYLDAELEYKKIKKILDDNEIVLLRQQAGILASNLSEGEACPVCGSKEHPVLAKIIDNKITQEELKKMKVKVDKSAHILSGISERCSICNEELNKLKEDIVKEASKYIDEIDQSYDIDRVSLLLKKYSEDKHSSIEHCDTKLLEIKQDIDSRKDIESTIEDSLKNMELFSIDFEKEKEISSKLALDEAALVTKLDSYKERVTTTDENQLYSMIASTSDKIKLYNLEINNFLDDEKKLNNTIAGLKGKVNTLKVDYTDSKYKEDMLYNQYKAILESCGFNDEARYLDVLHTECIEDIKETIKIYNEQTLKYNELIHNYEKDLKDITFVDLSDIKKCIESVNEDIAKLNNTLATINEQIGLNSRLIEDIENTYYTSKKKQDYYALIKNLSDTANGALKGKEKIRFERYVQAYYFRRIVNQANQRFINMTNGQYMLICKDSTDTQKANQGLDLYVMDYYIGKERPVSSLSGGESFKAALCMSLGMSDVIQQYAGGIEVDAMFIDEGFGSLDRDSIEQAVDVLLKLTDGDRMVGIISHVEDLKQRIDRKLVVTKTSQGSYVSIA